MFVGLGQGLQLYSDPNTTCQGSPSWMVLIMFDQIILFRRFSVLCPHLELRKILPRLFRIQYWKFMSSYHLALLTLVGKILQSFPLRETPSCPYLHPPMNLCLLLNSTQSRAEVVWNVVAWSMALWVEFSLLVSRLAPMIVHLWSLLKA